VTARAGGFPYSVVRCTGAPGPGSGRTADVVWLLQLLGSGGGLRAPGLPGGPPCRGRPRRRRLRRSRRTLARPEPDHSRALPHPVPSAPRWPRTPLLPACPGLDDNSSGAAEARLLEAEQGDSISGRVSRAEAAAVIVAALDNPEASNKTFELRRSGPGWLRGGGGSSRRAAHEQLSAAPGRPLHNGFGVWMRGPPGCGGNHRPEPARARGVTDCPFTLIVMLQERSGGCGGQGHGPAAV
jgi:hypothetical protein